MTQAFGDWLRNMLDQRNMSQADVARRTNASRQSVSRWISNLDTPRPESCVSLAAALQVTPQEVMVAAGLMDASTSVQQELIELVRYLPDERVPEVIRFVRFLTQDRRGSFIQEGVSEDDSGVNVGVGLRGEGE